jgi:YD repeat-containing protein
VRIIGAVNDTSVVTRDATTGLVTRFRNPLGQVWGLTYDSRGNLLTQSDSTHEGHGTGGYQVATMRYTYHDENAPDSPDSIIDPEGVVTRFRYGANGLDSLATAPSGHVTRFTYETGSLAGLLRSVVEIDVRVNPKAS